MPGFCALIVFSGTACRQVEETDNPVSGSLSRIGATSPRAHSSTSSELLRLQFDDVPVPDGFFLRNQRNESYSYTLGGRRVGRFVYWGRGSVEGVQKLYLETMRKDPYNWRLPTSSVESSDLLVFEKPGEVCKVRVQRVPTNATDILVTIWVESH